MAKINSTIRTTTEYVLTLSLAEFTALEKVLGESDESDAYEIYQAIIGHRVGAY